MMRKGAEKLIQLYQKCLSPLKPSCCRFYPSCSEYAKISFREHGVLKGSVLFLKRMFRCHPLSKGGIDWPPSKKVKP